MIHIEFKNLRASEIVREAVLEKLNDDLDRFPDLKDSTIHVTVRMDNSPHQAGPDLFGVKLRITSGRYRGIILEKEGPTFYSALGSLDESLVERLNRFGEKKTTLKRKTARRKRAS